MKCQPIWYKNIFTKDCDDINTLSIEYIIEICAIEIPKLNVILVVLYWPDSNREKIIFNSQLEKLLQLIKFKYNKRNIIIGGDLNVDVLSKTKQTRIMIELFQSYNFHQNVNEPTRISKTTAKCIDVIYTNFDNTNYTISIDEYGISDHKATQITLLKTKININKPYSIVKRPFNLKNLALFKAEIEKINWETIITSDKDINKNYEAFHEQLVFILNRCIPKRKVLIKIKKKVWLSKGIKISCKNKRLLKIFNSKTNNLILNEYYKKYELMLKKAVKTSKRLHYINKMKISNNKTRAMWQIIKERTNKISKKDKKNITLKLNNKTITAPSQIAKNLNSFFVSIGNVQMSTNERPRGRPVIDSNINTMYLSLVTPLEVHNIIQSLKNKLSCGIDEFPPILIKYCKENLIIPLTMLINQSFSEATFPNMLKTSIIKPIPKTRTANNPENFRPIALLSTFSKIFESAMAKRLSQFCEKFNIYNESQHGFRKQRSTMSALYELTQEILKIIDERKYAIGIMLDMSKAYDRVSHKILLNKLYGIGVRGPAYEWFVSYLNNRDQYVEIQYFDPVQNKQLNVKSPKLKINNAIPQGSVLGCILFLIYINDLSNIIDEKSILYADDITVIFPCNNPEELKLKINNTLETIIFWLKEHNLELNLAKTKIMQFKPHQKLPLNINNLKFSNRTLTSVNTCNLLGVSMDTCINWKSHIDKIAGKLSRFTYALYELKKSTDLKTATSAYYAYAHSWLSYCIIIWGNSNDVNRLFILQKKCIRIIVNITEMETCRPHFIKQKILTLTSLYIYEICKFVRTHKKIFTLAKDKYTKPHNLRHKDKLTLPYTKLQIVRSGTHHMSIQIYNKLPTQLQTIKKKSIFLKNLKVFLIEKCYYNLKEYFDGNA